MLRRILVILGYLGLTLSVVAITFLLVAYGKDYSYDFTTHKIIQKGHIIIQTTPNGVPITVAGRSIHKKTPYQAAWSVGSHDFSLSKDGFWPWQKKLTVVAGQVTLAQYVILVPKQPKTTVLDSRSQILTTAISQDHRHLAYITGGADAALYTMDLGNGKPVKLYTPKAATPTAGAEVLTGVAWSYDASHLLISSTIDGTPTYRLAAAGGGEPVNLTAQYGAVSGLQFSSNDWRVLYWIDNGGLRRLDVGAQTMSDVLSDKVSQFWVIPNRVLYVQDTSLGRSLWSLDSNNHHQELIPALAESPSYAVAYASFLDQDELAVVPSATQIGTLYLGIFSDTPVAQTIAHGVTDVSFSPDGHLAAFTAPNAIETYDLQNSQINNTFVRYDVTDQPGALSVLTWFDSYHLLITRGTELFWSEYDGANRVDLGPVATGLPAYALSGSDPKGLVLVRSAASGVRITQLQIRQ